MSFLPLGRARQIGMGVRHAAVLLVLLLLSSPLNAQPTLRIAIASNFSATAELLIDEFKKQHSITVIPLIGSTGKHAMQIGQGLQVDVFLAADGLRPKWLESKSLAIKGSRFTYALGQLAVFSLNQSHVDDVLQGHLEGLTLAIANPKLAPYGIAAKELLEPHKLAVGKANSIRIVQGDSVAQAFQFAASGAAHAALIAYSQAKMQTSSELDSGFYELIPSSRYSAIEQQAIMVRDSKLAATFMMYLQSEGALHIIEKSGYLRPK